MKIRTQLWLVFTAATIAPLLLVGVIAYNASRTRLLAQADASLVAVAERVAQEFELFILHAEEGLRSDGLVPQFAEFLAASGRDRAQRENSVRQLLVNAIANDPVNITLARLFDPTGRVVCQTEQLGPPLEPDQAPWVVGALTGGLPLAQLGHEGDGDEALWVAAPVRDPAGRVVGCLALRYELTVLQQIVARSSRSNPPDGAGAFAVLVDAFDRILADGGEDERSGSAWPSITPDVPANGSTVAESIGRGLVSSQARATSVPDRVVQIELNRMPWRVAMVVPSATHESAVAELRGVMLLLAVLGVVLGMVSTAVVAHRVSRPLMTMVEAARRIGQGDFEIVMPGVGRGEVGVLVDAFNRMAEALRATLRTLEERITEVRRSKETLAELIAFSPVAIAEHSADERTLCLNAKFGEMFGYTVADVPNLAAWWPLAYPDPRYRRDVQVHWERLAAEAAARGGEAEPMEADVTTASGGQRRIEFRARQIGDRWVTIFVDLTDRVREEETRRRLEDQLRQAQKLEAVGTLAGGIAHDFNNVLIGIMGNTELALTRLQGNADVREFLHDALAASRRARELVARILTFARQAEVDLQPVQIGPVVDEAARLLRASLPAAIEIEVAVAPAVPSVLCDPIQIHQIVMNLGFNAAHAMPTGGTLRFEVKPVRVTTADQARFPQLREEHSVLLAVSDTGLGMDAATLTRVFEPFFTTKQVGEGTGLGLAVVHGILRMLDAAAVISSEPGRGTTFELYFPGGVEAAPAAAVDLPFQVVGHGESLLLVDDEEAVLRAMERMLRTMGFQVAAFQQPEAALKAVQEGSVQPVVVISDVSMPIMDGVQLAASLRAQLPQCPILFMTGNPWSLNNGALDTLGILEVLSKPLSMAELGAALARALPAVPAEPRD